jgi:hypothetical protein
MLLDTIRQMIEIARHLGDDDIVEGHRFAFLGVLRR